MLADPVTVVEEVTPEVAQSYLATNMANNRAVRPGWVSELCSIILTGQWDVQHTGIAFDVTGKLIDGQHRLLAIIRTGLAVRMNVTRGVAVRVATSCDGGKIRNPADVLRISGYKYSNSTFAAVLRQMVGGMSGPQNVSKSEILACAQRHGEAAAFGTALFPQKVKHVGIAPVRAAIARASYSHDKARLVEFAEVLQTGLPKNMPEDQAAIVLRNHLISSPSVRNASSVADTYAKVERALQAFLAREPLSRLHAVQREAFALPDRAIPTQG
jgi:hypothetical protein